MDPSNELSAATPQEAAVGHNDPIPGGLYEELKQEKAKFNAFMKSTSCALDGSVHSLYDRFEYVYQKRDELIDDPAEFDKFKTDEFFECSDVKPNERNLIRQLLYFFNDAKTKRKRDRWSKAATVLEHFRSLGIGHGDVTRLVKEGGGFVKLYNSLPSAKSDDDGVQADHDVFATDTSVVGDSAIGSINLAERGPGTAAIASDAFQDAVAVQLVDGSNEAQGRELSDPNVAVASPTDSADVLVAPDGAGEHSSPPATMRDALKNNVLLRTLPLEKEIALTPGRVVVFAVVTAHDRWNDVQTVQVIHLDGEQSEWPTLDFSGQTSQRSAPNTLSSAVDSDPHEPKRLIPHVSNSAVDAPPKQRPAPSAPTETKPPMAAARRSQSISGASHANTAKAKDALSGRSGMRLADSKAQNLRVIEILPRAPGKTVTVVAWSSAANLPKPRKAK